MLEELLETRYPQLAFLIKTHSRQKLLSKEEQDIPPSEIETFANRVRAQNPSLILLIGIQVDAYIGSIKEWIHTHPEVDVLIFEENLDRMMHYLEMSTAKCLIEHPQLQLRYILEHKTLSEALKEAVVEYPVESILLEITPHYRNTYSLEELSLEVMRKATITSSLFNEDVYYHLLFRNLLANFRSLPSCFYADSLRGKFKDIPAVICGAGPSLALHIPLLRQMGNKALIIAGGSTLAALSTQGVIPHIGLALDPNPEEYDRLKANHAVQVPLLFGSRVASSIFRTCHGPAGYMRTFSGGLAEKALEEKLDFTQEPFLTEPLLMGISQEGLSVTVMAFAAAVHCGCNPIFLSGIDLAYVGDQRYAPGVVVDASIAVEALKQEYRVSDKVFSRKNRQGEEVYTTVKWIMEAATIEEFAKQYPEIKVFDCIERGLGFPGFEKLDLAKASELYLQKEYDLRNYVHMRIEETPNFSSKKEEIDLFIQELRESFQVCARLVEQMLLFLKTLAKDNSVEKDPLEQASFTLWVMDLHEQKAYQYFLLLVEELLNPILMREYRIEEDKNKKHVELLQKKYKHFERLIQHYLEVLETTF
jgi:hypothetical protein